jgi:hypothetical protein
MSEYKKACKAIAGLINTASTRHKSQWSISELIDLCQEMGDLANKAIEDEETLADIAGIELSNTVAIKAMEDG